MLGRWSLTQPQGANACVRPGEQHAIGRAHTICVQGCAVFALQSVAQTRTNHSFGALTGKGGSRQGGIRGQGRAGCRWLRGHTPQLPQPPASRQPQASGACVYAPPPLAAPSPLPAPLFCPPPVPPQVWTARPLRRLRRIVITATPARKPHVAATCHICKHAPRATHAPPRTQDGISTIHARARAVPVPTPPPPIA